eukprot:TRINITY_DN7087_c3_g2_i2.p2 TRINITY_DN7087_c3_g2~~TRINITY_DN7087_c3_g2_i2.p2  ORF type:complete len:122 (+),score=38.28 TRINITY_DN7087_c3_g2_i2:191-556(+)
MGFGLVAGVPRDRMSGTDPAVLLLAYPHGPFCCVSGVKMVARDGEPDLGCRAPFRILVSSEMRVSWEMRSGSPEQQVLHSCEKTNRLFAEAVARLPRGTPIHPFIYVHLIDEGNPKWTVAP